MPKVKILDVLFTEFLVQTVTGVCASPAAR